MIRKKLLNPELVPSSYDTAWVAMVPAQGDPHAPRFRGYVKWILENQHSDGSWGLGYLSPRWLGKDCICSTLACILALKTWNIGDEHIRKGINTKVTYISIIVVYTSNLVLVAIAMDLCPFRAPLH